MQVFLTFFLSVSYIISSSSCSFCGGFSLKIGMRSLGKVFHGSEETNANNCKIEVYVLQENFH